MNLYKMTIGTSTFYTTKSRFAIEIFAFFQYFFEFFVNLYLFLLKFNKFLQFCACQKNFRHMIIQIRFFSIWHKKEGLHLFILTNHNREIDFRPPIFG